MWIKNDNRIFEYLMDICGALFLNMYVITIRKYSLGLKFEFYKKSLKETIGMRAAELRITCINDAI